MIEQILNRLIEHIEAKKYHNYDPKDNEGEYISGWNDAIDACLRSLGHEKETYNKDK